MSNKPGRKTSLLRLDEMVELLRDDIYAGKLPVDKYLPSEAELAKRFHLSNNTVRKGLDVLVQEGLIEKIPKVGNRVAAPAPDGSVVVRFGYHNTVAREADIHRLLEQFRQRHPHIRVQALQLPTENFYNALREYMNANMLDVVTMNDINFEVLKERDMVGLLDPLESGPSIYPFLTNAFSADGKQIVRPFLFSPVILCYNRDHFEQNRLPEPDSGWSWDDLFRVAKRLAVPGERFGFYYELHTGNRWPVFLLQSGVTFEPERRGKRKLSGTRLPDGLDVCRDLLRMDDVFPAMLSASNADVEELFAQGKVSMIMTTYLNLNKLLRSDIAFEIAPLPTFHEHRTLMIAIGLAVNRKSKVLHAARLLADYLTSYEAQLTIRQQTLSLPAHKQAAEWKGEETAYRPSRFNMYREIVPTFRSIADLKLKTTELLLVVKEARLYWSGLQDREAMCRNIERALSEELRP